MKKVISTTATLALLGGGMLFIPQASLAETTSASMSLSC